jgi:hypothetical protein
MQQSGQRPTHALVIIDDRDIQMRDGHDGILATKPRACLLSFGAFSADF